MLVPDNEKYDTESPKYAPIMSSPGAKISTHVPLFENVDIKSVIDVDPTAVTPETPAGDTKQASDASFPAAAITGIFLSLISNETTSSRLYERGEPRDIDTTAGYCTLS